MTRPADAQPPADQKGSNPELTLRVLTAAVLVPIALLVAWAGGIWFALLVAAGTALAGHEWSKLCDIDRPAAVALLIVIGPVLAIAQSTGGPAASLLVLLLALLSTFGGEKSTPNRIWPAIGVAYLGIPTVAILWVRADLQIGQVTLIYLFAVVWLTDIGAYAFGRTIGGPRLAPSISPGKTWAGAIGGLFLAVAVTLLAAWIMGSPRPVGAIALAFYLSIATQCGDLFESWVKRRFGKKDSGTIIPGHGGVLDRIDGLLFAAPVMAAIIIANSGAAP